MNDRMRQLAGINEYVVNDGSGDKDIDVEDTSNIAKEFSDKMKELAKESDIGDIVGFYVHKQFRRKHQLQLIGTKGVASIRFQDFKVLKVDKLNKVKV
jgi:hypothetical protein